MQMVDTKFFAQLASLLSAIPTNMPVDYSQQIICEIKEGHDIVVNKSTIFRRKLFVAVSLHWQVALV